MLQDTLAPLSTVAVKPTEPPGSSSTEDGNTTTGTNGAVAGSRQACRSRVVAREATSRHKRFDIGAHYHETRMRSLQQHKRQGRFRPVVEFSRDCAGEAVVEKCCMVLVVTACYSLQLVAESDSTTSGLGWGAGAGAFVVGGRAAGGGAGVGLGVGLLAFLGSGSLSVLALNSGPHGDHSGEPLQV